jgi:ankyrin repeat protein
MSRTYGIIILVALGLIQIFGTSFAADTATAQSPDAVVKSGSIDALRDYLASPGADINARSNKGLSLLDYAAEYNQVDVAKYLLEHGAKADEPYSNGQNRGVTPLSRAAFFGSYDVAKLLIERGVDINGPEKDTPTPLMYAAAAGNLRIAQLLLDHRADVNITLHDGQSAITAASQKGHLDLAKLLESHGAKVNVEKSLGEAAFNGHLDVVKNLIDQNPDQTAKDMALRWAVIGSNNRDVVTQVQIAKLLIAAGADVNNVGDKGVNTPLAMATQPLMLDELLAHGAIATFWGKPVPLAPQVVCAGKVNDASALIATFVQHKVDLDALGSSGMTALDCAAKQDNLELATALIQAGARTDIKGAGGNTALSYGSSERMLQFLRDHDASPTAGNNMGSTPLRAAVQKGNAQKPVFADGGQSFLPGLWEFTTAVAGASKDPDHAQLCTDADTADLVRQLSGGLAQAQCSKEQKTQGNTTTIDSICQIGSTKVSAHTWMVVTSDKAYHGTTALHYDPPLAGMTDGSVTSDAKWIGPCTEGMQPGDYITSNGMKVNVNAVLKSMAASHPEFGSSSK